MNLRTARLQLRELAPRDAPFILVLLNEPSFIQNIGDRGVRSLADAHDYLVNGPIASYTRHGFGLYLVELAATEEPIGICGILQREALPDPDLGFAFLPAYWGRGFAFEAAAAVRTYARSELGVGRLLAITSPRNDASIRLLEKLGFRFERMMRLANEETELKVFADEDEP